MADDTDLNLDDLEEDEVKQEIEAKSFFLE